MDSSDVRLRFSAVALVLSVAAFACGGSPTGNGDGNGNGGGGGGGGGGGPVATTSVEVQDNSFDPSAITVSPGATVTWTWRGSEQHDVTFDDSQFQNGPLQSSGTHSVTFPTAGTYDYECTQHAGMEGSVVVE